MSTRRLTIPVLPKIKLYFEDLDLPLDTIRGVPLITFPFPFYVGVTFLNATDSNRNQLGYFTLPPRVILPLNPSGVLNASLIFYDTTKPCTDSGDVMNIGPLPGGTQVGFFLITDGWCGGLSKEWSVTQYNEGKSMTAVFFDPPTNTMVIGMEDNPRQKNYNYQDVIFQVETKPPLNLTWFEGTIAVACNTPCPDCNFTTGKCPSEIISSSNIRSGPFIRRSVLMGILVCLGLFLTVAIMIIAYFVWQKTKVNKFLSGGWLPVMSSGSFMEDQEKSEEEKDDLEERLKDTDL